MTLAPVLRAVEDSKAGALTGLWPSTQFGTSEAAFERWRKNLCSKTFADIHDTPASIPDFLLPPLIARGALVLLSGPQKLGKTRFVLSLIKAATEQREYLGEMQKPLKALYLSEMDPASFGLYLQRYGLSKGDCFFQYFADAPRVPWDEKVRTILDEAERNGVDLIVFDTLFRWAEVHDEEVNQYGSMNVVMNSLIREKRPGISILVVHHDRKGGGSPGTRALGSVSISASVDDVISLSSIPNSPGRYVLTGAGRYIGKERRIFLSDDPTCVFTSFVPQASAAGHTSGIPLPSSATSPIRTDIETAVKALVSGSYAQIKKTLAGLGKEYPRRTLQRALYEMRDGGLLKATTGRRPRYSLPA